MTPGAALVLDDDDIIRITEWIASTAKEGV